MKDIIAEIDACDEISYKVDYDKKKYDIIVISFDTSSSKQAYIHSKEFKKRGAYIVMGGYHTSAVPKEAAEHCDTVIIGAGEISLPEFFHDYLKGEPKKIYNNQNIDVRKIKMVPRNLIKSKRYMKVSPVIADRGCDNKCSFCAISEMWKSNPRPVEDVIEEIKSLKSDKIIFFDPNFFYPKEYSLKLMKEMEKLKIKWAGQGTLNMAKDKDLLTAMKKSGCEIILIGFESLDTDNLKQMNKAVNIMEAERDELVQRIHNAGIGIYATFVFGYDNDTQNTIKKAVEFSKKHNFYTAAFNHLLPFPGTKLYDRLKSDNRLLYDKWWLEENYNYGELAFKPKQMSPEELSKACQNARKEFASFKTVFKRGIQAMRYSSPMLWSLFWIMNLSINSEIDQKINVPIGRNLDEFPK